MGKITYKSKVSDKAVLIGFNVSYGNDPQPLYEAGKKDIACVIELEALAQVSVQRALFKDDQVASSKGSETLAIVPSFHLDYAILKYNYSASSGQAYVVENLTIIGKKTSAGAQTQKTKTK